MSESQVPNTFRYSIELLSEYSGAALENARELIDEAILLFENGHLARSYFIAVAAIEEIGKSFMAFDAQGRNLNDSAVTARIRNSLESHSKKINAAFHASVLSHGDLENELQGIIDLMISIKHGREPSMYTDINYIDQQVYRPRVVVREVAAKDCIRLAQHCFYKTELHLKQNDPAPRSANEDAFYGMKDRRVTDLFNNEDFWWFHISNMESGATDLAASVVNYQRKFLSKGRMFKASEGADSDT